jgi:hypothetical protein
MGYADNQFIEAFARNVKLQNQAAIEDSPVAQAIICFMENKPTWKGSAGELLLSLSELAPKLSINTKNHKIWPSKSNVLTRRLKYITSNLKEYNITIHYDQDPKTRVRIINIEKHPSNPSDPSQTQNHAQNTSDIAKDESSPKDIISFEDKTSFDKTPQNHAQNSISRDVKDAKDVFGNMSIAKELNIDRRSESGLKVWSCNNCNFECEVEKDYLNHIINKHRGMSGNPDKNGRELSV